MKLALITPRGVFQANGSGASTFFRTFHAKNRKDFSLPRHEFWSGGSLGLLIVAALTPPDFEIDFIDESYEEINFGADYDLVGISSMTQQTMRAYEIADEFRKRGVKVAIGGIHATVLPEEAKEHADSIVIGEAENTWPQFIQDFIKNEIKPFYKSNYPVDLNKSPLPRYDLLKKYDYKMIWVQTTRGCPRDCDFCCASNVYGKKYRHKNIDQVLREISYIRDLWNEPVINFADDNMFVNKEFSYELVRRLGDANLRWLAQTDVSIGDDGNFLKLLRSSGCMLLFIGFETLSQRNELDKHGWKREKINKYGEVINNIQSNGIGIMGAFIIGLDDDDQSVVEEMSSFIVNNNLYAVQVTILTPLPGTRLRERLLRENRILTSNWSKYTFEDVIFLPKKMKPIELQESLFEIYKRVYNRSARMAVVRYFKGIYAKLNA